MAQMPPLESFTQRAPLPLHNVYWTGRFKLDLSRSFFMSIIFNSLRLKIFYWITNSWTSTWLCELMRFLPHARLKQLGDRAKTFWTLSGDVVLSSPSSPRFFKIDQINKCCFGTYNDFLDYFLKLETCSLYVHVYSRSMLKKHWARIVGQCSDCSNKKKLPVSFFPNCSKEIK